jgi:hypothetical protein
MDLGGADMFRDSEERIERVTEHYVLPSPRSLKVKDVYVIRSRVRIGDIALKAIPGLLGT